MTRHRNIILFDINGTILPSEHKYSPAFFATEDMIVFRNLLKDFTKLDYSIGLNSDSPLEQMQEFSEESGIHADIIIAENGAVINGLEYDIVLTSLSQREVQNLKQDISTICEKTITSSIIAPEFRGGSVSRNECAFGANRKYSLTFFGPEKIIEKIGTEIKKLHYTSISYDVSPQYNFFAAHKIPPNIESYKQKKSIALLELTKFFDEVVMVGDSKSDITPDPRVKTYLVGNQSKQLYEQNRQYIKAFSEKTSLSGVDEICLAMTKQD